MYTCHVRSWKRFVSSLLTILQSVCVELEYTDIDDETVRRIQNSPHITVTHYDGGREDMSARSWERFVSSLLTNHQSVHVELEKTNMYTGQPGVVRRPTS